MRRVESFSLAEMNKEEFKDPQFVTGLPFEDFTYKSQDQMFIYRLTQDDEKLELQSQMFALSATTLVTAINGFPFFGRLS